MFLLIVAIQDPLLSEEGARRVDSFPAGRPLVAAYCTRPTARDLEEMVSTGVDLAVVSETAAQGAPSPKLAPFTDADYEGVRKFYATYAPERWAAIEGRPVVWLRPSVRALPEKLVERFRADFRGRSPFLVAEWSAIGIAADRRYAWGEGPRDLEIMSVGTGERDTTRSWCAVLRSKPTMVAIETWESMIAEKRNEATVRFVEKFRKGETIANPAGAWTGQRRIAYNLKYAPHALGLTPVSGEVLEIGSLRLLSTKGQARVLSFDADDSYAFWERRSVTVEVDYLDLGAGSFTLEYDSADTKLGIPNRWLKAGGEVLFSGSNEIKTAKFELRDAFFGNRQPGGSDFRLAARGRGIAVRRVLVKPN